MTVMPCLCAVFIIIQYTTHTGISQPNRVAFHIVPIVTAARASLSEVLAMEEGMNTIRTVMEEIVASGKANGIKFPNGIVDTKLEDAVSEADEFQSSLQSDFNRGGKLELDDILGAAVRLGREAGIPMPASSAMVLTLQKFKGGSPS